MRPILAVFCIFILSTSAFSAEYQGRNIDGERFFATAYSHSTSKYYNVEVEFDGDECTIYFSKGGNITVTLDDEEIDDPSDIPAYDYKRNTHWDLDVDLD